MKKNIQWIIAVSIVSLIFVWRTAQANAITGMVYEGTGCPQGTIGSSRSSDGQKLILIFDGLVAAAGPSVQEDAAAKYCRIDLTLQTNDSVVLALDARGSAQLPAGMTGNQHQDVPSATSINPVTPFVGPTDQNYLVHSMATVLAQGNPAQMTVTIILQVGVDKGSNTTDRGQLTTDSVEITLHGAPPIATTDFFTTTSGTPVSGNVLTNDSDPDGDLLQAIKVANPQYGSVVLNLDGSFIYTPTIPGYLGADYFGYKANDGVADSPVVKVNVTIQRINRPPVAQNDNYTTWQDTSLIIFDRALTVLANDTDPDRDSLGEAFVRSGPSHGLLTFNGGSGAFTYQPAPGYVGVDSFTYQVVDKVRDATPALSNIATATITVKAPQPPVITVALDMQPDSKTNVKFTTGLGNFTLDDNTPQDKDVYTNTKRLVVTPGTYTVQEQNVSGWFVTAITCTPAEKGVVDLANRQVTITAAPNDNITCIFVTQRAGKITAGKYNDRNHNHNRNGKDEWLSGWTMQLYSDPNTLVATQSTDAKGRTTFTDLRPGLYTLCELPQNGWYNITPHTLDPSYAKPCYPVRFAPGQAVAALFGNSTTPLVTGAETSNFNDVVIMELPDTDDEGNMVAPLPDPWPDAPAEGANTLFLPLVTR